MRRIMYTRPDGGLSIVIPVVSLDDPEDFSEDDAFDRTLSKDVPPDAQNVVVVDASEIPLDRTYRNAWVHRDGAIAHDMTKAADIHRSMLRGKRAPLLAALDVDFMRAFESGDMPAIADIGRRKQALRDITRHPDIDAAKTPDDLKKITV